MGSDPAMLEVARQLGVIQTLLNQEEVSHRQIMMDLEAMSQKLNAVAECVEANHVALHPDDVPSVVDDVSQIANIVHRRAKIAAAVAVTAGAVLGGAAGSELRAVIKNLLDVLGGQI